MYDENASFSLDWAPQTFPPRQPTAEGAWRVVSDDGSPVGVVWMQSSPASAGVSWINQSESIEKLRQHFKDAVAADTPPIAAYNMTDFMGLQLSSEQRGALSGVDDDLQEMSEEA